MKIKDMLESELPIERLLKVGVNNLSNEELIAIIFRNGTKEINVKELALEVLNKYKNINDLRNITFNSLNNIKGVGRVKACSLLASLELGKRVYYYDSNKKIKLNHHKKIFEYFKDILIYEEQEVFIAVYLDTKGNLISYRELFRGSLSSSYVHPREVFKYALLEGAYQIIVIHNHPSNDTTPSNIDIELTNHLFDSGNIIGIPIVDHIIIGKDNYYSFFENMNK